MLGWAGKSGLAVSAGTSPRRGAGMGMGWNTHRMNKNPSKIFLEFSQRRLGPILTQGYFLPEIYFTSLFYICFHYVVNFSLNVTVIFIFIFIFNLRWEWG